MGMFDIPAGRYRWSTYEGRSDYRNRCVACGDGLVSGENEMFAIALECARENDLGEYESDCRVDTNQGLIVQFERGHVFIGR